jgi:hypothetical protein
MEGRRRIVLPLDGYAPLLKALFLYGERGYFAVATVFQ